MSVPNDQRPGPSLEQRLSRDAQRLGDAAPDVAGRIEFAPRSQSVRREAHVGLLARAAVCGALAVFLLVGADERAGLRGAGRFVSSAQPRLETPVAPAAAVKELATFLSGTHPLGDEWEALARDTEDLLDEFAKRVAPLAWTIQEDPR